MAVHDYGFCDKCKEWHDMEDGSCDPQASEEYTEEESIELLKYELVLCLFDLFLSFVNLASTILGIWMIWHFSHSYPAVLGGVIMAFNFRRR